MIVRALDAGLDLALRATALALSPRRREWVRAMRAELVAIDDPRERTRLLLGGVMGAMQLIVREWSHPGDAWLLSVAAGLAIPFADVHETLPCVLVPLLILTGLAFGFANPIAPMRWTLTIAAGLVITQHYTLTDVFLDRGDVPGVATTLAACVYAGAIIRRAAWQGRAFAR